MKHFNFSDEKVLDNFLRARPLPPPSQNLTARILAAVWRSAVEPMSVGQWLGELFADFMLPKPAYVLSGLLVAGFVAGFTITPMMTADDAAGNPQMILDDTGDMP